MTDITPRKADALIDALLFGSIWSTTGALSQRMHHKITISRLRQAGLIRYESSSVETRGIYAGGWVLTDEGQKVARSLDDTLSSASRQHFIDTGAYLTFGDREDLNPADFAKDDVVRYKLDQRGKRYRIEAVRWVPDGNFHEYDAVLLDGQEDSQFLGMRYYGLRLSKTAYEIVRHEPVRDWETLAPVAANAAVLVALGRGDEMVEDYSDGVITALELLQELVKAGE